MTTAHYPEIRLCFKRHQDGNARVLTCCGDLHPREVLVFRQHQ